MIPHFIGIYDTIPIASGSDTYTFQRDFGFVRDDNIMVIAPKCVDVNGANIPRLLWLFLGSPLSGKNKEWSAHHDVLYAKEAIIIDCRNLNAESVTTIFENWRELAPDYFIHQACMPKFFADDTMRQAMIASDSNMVKRWIAYHGVRIFGHGWWS